MGFCGVLIELHKLITTQPRFPPPKPRRSNLQNSAYNPRVVDEEAREFFTCKHTSHRTPYMFVANSSQITWTTRLIQGFWKLMSPPHLALAKPKSWF